MKIYSILFNECKLSVNKLHLQSVLIELHNLHASVKHELSSENQ